MDDLINPNPIIHARRHTQRRAPGGGAAAAAAAASSAAAAASSSAREPIDALEIFEHLRDITDPEHPYTLEQLNVLEEAHIDVDDAAGRVRCVSVLWFLGGGVYRLLWGCVCNRAIQAATTLHHHSKTPPTPGDTRVRFTPTVEHCSMATLIGLCIRVKLLRCLPPRFKVDIEVGAPCFSGGGAGWKTGAIVGVTVC